MWNDDWRMELERYNEATFERLCECRNTKRDIYVISCFMADYNKDKTAEECLDRVCEWICGWNNQFELELTQKEYNMFLKNLLERKVL